MILKIKGSCLGVKIIQIAPAGKLFDSEQFFDTDRTIAKTADDHTKHLYILEIHRNV